jgi:predicted RNA-binding Zn-ribbon protein involved in translation (DUF1610 family)
MTASERGVLYRCPVCGAEVMILVRQHGAFEPRCCNMAMLKILRQPAFLVCPICGTQIAVWRPQAPGLSLRCCNEPMRHMAA